MAVPSAMPTVGDILEIKIGTYCVNQAGINVCHYTVVGTGIPAASLAQIAKSFDDSLAPLYKAYMGTTASFYGVSAKILNGSPPPPAVVSATNIGAGTMTGGMLPLQVAGVITKVSLKTGRAHRGRVYLPFPAGGNNDATTETPTDAAVAKFEDIAEYLFTETTVTVGDASTTLVPVIKHSGGLTNTQVAGWVTRDKWANQRRRGNYGQANTYPPF